MWKYTTFTLSGTETLNWVSYGNEKLFAHMSIVTLAPRCPLHFSIVTGSQSGDLYDVLCPISKRDFFHYPMVRDYFLSSLVREHAWN